MGWRRHSGAVVSLALLASVVGHYAISIASFEVRFQRLVRRLARSTCRTSGTRLAVDANARR